MTDLIEESWADVLAFLPPELDTLARETGALKYRRGVRSGADLLRVAFVYSVLDLSLRSTAAWAQTQGMELSDVAVYKRLRGSVSFLEALLAQFVHQQLEALPRRASPLPWRIRLMDATVVSHPGSQGTDWRIHASYDPVQGTIDALTLTDGTGSEHLGRCPGQPGELQVADRGYAQAERILTAVGQGGQVLVRLGSRSLKLWDESGARLDPVAFAEATEGAARVFETAVTLRGKPGTCPARLIVIRKSVEATEQEHKRVRRRASRKGARLTSRSVRAASFVFLLTTVPATQATAVFLSELYRVRWQVELVFKRWKSLLQLDALRAKEVGLARSYLLAKLLAACLTDLLSRTARDVSPWGVPLAPPAQSLALVAVGT
jgi:DDE family transposase